MKSRWEKPVRDIFQRAHFGAPAMLCESELVMGALTQPLERSVTFHYFSALSWLIESPLAPMREKRTSSHTHFRPRRSRFGKSKFVKNLPYRPPSKCYEVIFGEFVLFFFKVNTANILDVVLIQLRFLSRSKAKSVQKEMQWQSKILVAFTRWF